MSRQTIYRLLDGSTPNVATVQRLDQALEGESPIDTDVTHPAPVGWNPAQGKHLSGGEGWKADREGSPAEQLIYMVQHPEMLRRFSGTPSIRDAVKAAFAIAVDEEFSEEEMNKLQAWRRDLLSQEE